ncbi:DUF4238 domain-containing protein [Bacillus thuringiensis]|uniref:DUF4238 domain-containing protein n=1 Tax=Bacillus thuringiensis TaxID=1428 RepID=UPI001367FCF7|nr:DUF4238 domain-containing protein [Bacillus thuringiensis]MYW23031.1 DUF4238 domain-containing protein [Bacillus thuringiensis]
MAEKNDFVKKQHYIPQFSIKPFEITEGYCLTVILKTTPFKITRMSTKNIMQENDLYEVKNTDGEYVNRNEMEDIYSKIENSIAHSFREFVPLLASNEVEVEFKKNFATIEWQRNETNLLEHLIFTLIRSPHLKNLIYDKKETPDFMKPIFYRLMTTTRENAEKLAKNHLIGDKLEIALHSLKTSPQGGLQVLYEHLMNNFQLRIYKTRGEKKFYLSDRPILVNKFEEADYVLPISPNICIGAIPLQIIEGKIFSQITYLSDDDVNRINKKIIENAEKMLIIQSEADIEFVKEWKKNIKGII